MNREIKFRVWEKHYQRMSKVTLIEWKPSYLYHRICTQEIVKGKKIDEQYAYEFGGDSNGIVLMQYTGRQDKNGKEIYEGDIIQDERGKKYLIKWGINSNGFIAITNEPHCNVYSSYHLSFKTQVIGNIYENPELLEESK